VGNTGRQKNSGQETMNSIKVQLAKKERTRTEFTQPFTCGKGTHIKKGFTHRHTHCNPGNRGVVGNNRSLGPNIPRTGPAE